MGSLEQDTAAVRLSEPPAGTAVLAARMLAADLGRFADEAAAAAAAGCEWLHIDIMDGHYVPQISFGAAAVAAARGAVPDAIVDVHLMVEQPEHLIAAVADAGADRITYHPDSTHQAWRCADMIGAAGCKPGCALSPAAGLDCVSDLAAAVELLLVMTVEPGYGGQSMIASMAGKVAAARAFLDRRNPDARLQVDGGISPETLGMVRASGADTFVIGSALFGSSDYAQTAADLRSSANG